jgi:hypothetical protein
MVGIELGIEVQPADTAAQVAYTYGAPASSMPSGPICAKVVVLPARKLGAALHSMPK